MIQDIDMRMLDHQSCDSSGENCVYLADDGNRCSIGVFIPDGHAGEKSKGMVQELLHFYPDLNALMPLDIDGLVQLQFVHDKINGGLDRRPALKAWINENVED
jgi:hypothetical protein